MCYYVVQEAVPWITTNFTKCWTLVAQAYDSTPDDIRSKISQAL